MASKISLYLTGLVVVLGVWHYGAVWRGFKAGPVKESYNVTLPSVPVLKRQVPRKKLLAEPILWNLPPSQDNQKKVVQKKKNGSANKRFRAKGAYAFKMVRGVPSLCKRGNRNYRWEFYGTLYKGKRFMAIFYNPVRKKVEVRGKYDPIDKDLKVMRVWENRVKVADGKSGMYFLEIFRISRNTKESRNR